RRLLATVPSQQPVSPDVQVGQTQRAGAPIIRLRLLRKIEPAQGQCSKARAFDAPGTAVEMIEGLPQGLRHVRSSVGRLRLAQRRRPCGVPGGHACDAQQRGGLGEESRTWEHSWSLRGGRIRRVFPRGAPGQLNCWRRNAWRLTTLYAMRLGDE